MTRGIIKPKTVAPGMPLTPTHRQHHRLSEGEDGLWVPRRSKKPCPPRTCYVYLLVHQSENRFKIGKSIRPKGRIAQLPERESLDWARSLQVKLPDAARAGQIESMLHKALAGFRLQRLPWNGSAAFSEHCYQQPWDGATEWFNLSGLRHAIQLLRALPGIDEDDSEPTLQTLQGQPCWPELQDQNAAPFEKFLLDAERYNLARLDEIHSVLMVIGRRLRITWTPQPQSRHSAGILRIHDLKSAWDLDMLKVRFEVVSSALWELKSGKADPKRARVPLVKLIRYAQEHSGTLELVANAIAPVRRAPGGGTVTRRWMCLCEGYET